MGLVFKKTFLVFRRLEKNKKREYIVKSFYKQASLKFLYSYRNYRLIRDAMKERKE